jgi:hypothetical protein
MCLLLQIYNDRFLGGVETYSIAVQLASKIAVHSILDIGVYSAVIVDVDNFFIDVDIYRSVIIDVDACNAVIIYVNNFFSNVKLKSKVENGSIL